MATAKELILMRNECEKTLRIADELMSKNDFSKVLSLYKNSVNKAEEIFRLSGVDEDRELVIKVYEHIAKYYRLTYQRTKVGPESYQAITYYEKIIYLYKEVLDKVNEETKKLYLKNMLENMIQLINLALENKNYSIYREYIKEARPYALQLMKLNPVYESEQYLILIYVFKGDYYRFNKKYRKAYFFYYIAMRRVKKIFEDLPQDEIKNDLIAIYTSLYEISLLLNKNRSKNRFKTLILELNGEKA